MIGIEIVKNLNQAQNNGVFWNEWNFLGIAQLTVYPCPAWGDRVNTEIS